jgi:hypothetical protein
MRIFTSYFSLSLAVIMLFVCIERVFAQDISLVASVNRNVLTLSDQLQLTLTIDGTQDTSPPAFPSVEGFNLLYGPKISAQTSIINGAVSVSKSYIYVLQPIAKGKFTIGPSSVDYKGKTYTSSSISVEVTDVQALPQTYLPDFEKLVSAELSTDKNEAYIYEQVVLSFKFYFQKGLPISDIEYTAPSVKNFMEEKLGDQRQYEIVRDGIVYNVLELRSAVFPMISGELTITPARLKFNLVVQQRRERQNNPYDSFFDNSFFDEFFGKGQKRYPVERVTKAVALKVKPLPEQGKPKDFNGVVGNFNMEASIKTQRVKVGDPITLSISVYGDGNIQTISAPLLILNNENDFKIYPAESDTQITNREELIRGRKTFSKVIEPQKADLKFIPAIVFSFFDPQAGQYKTITKEPIPIVVESGEQEIPIQLTISSPDAPLKQQVRILTQDILPIMTNLSSLRNQRDVIYKSLFFIACISVPAIAVATSFFITRHKEKLQTDVEYARDRKAHGVAKRRLAHAKSMLSENASTEFYSALSKVIADYLADKFNISAASTSADNIDTLLKQRGMGDVLIGEVSNFLSDLEYKRFSKDKGTMGEMINSLKFAEQIISKLEKQL